MISFSLFILSKELVPYYFRNLQLEYVLSIISEMMNANDPSICPLTVLHKFSVISHFNQSLHKNTLTNKEQLLKTKHMLSDLFQILSIKRDQQSSYNCNNSFRIIKTLTFIQVYQCQKLWNKCWGPTGVSRIRV